MRVGFISDLHIDVNRGYGVKEAITQVCLEDKIDRLYLAGDTYNSAQQTLAFEIYMGKVGVDTRSLFGNHEFYEVGNKFNEFRSAQYCFPDILPGDIGVIGVTGWYDYSWARLGSLGQLRKGKTPGGTWSDHRWIKYPEDVIGDSATWFLNENVKELKDQSEWLDSLGIKRKIVMLHMVPHYSLLEQSPNYIYTNAFFGSQVISDLVNEIAPEYCIYGHTHFAKDTRIGNTEYVCRPLGYYFEWGVDTAYDRIKNRMFVLEV